ELLPLQPSREDAARKAPEAPLRPRRWRCECRPRARGADPDDDRSRNARPPPDPLHGSPGAAAATELAGLTGAKSGVRLDDVLVEALEPNLVSPPLLRIDGRRQGERVRQLELGRGSNGRGAVRE